MGKDLVIRVLESDGEMRSLDHITSHLVFSRRNSYITEGLYTNEELTKEIVRLSTLLLETLVDGEDIAETILVYSLALRYSDHNQVEISYG